MYFSRIPNFYTIFDDLIVWPKNIFIGQGAFIPNSIESNLIEEGLVLPYYKVKPSKNIPIDYFGSDKFLYATGRIFTILSMKGLFTEYFAIRNPSSMDHWIYPEGVSRHIFSDEDIEVGISPFINDFKDVHEYGEFLERRLGIDPRNFIVYKKKDLIQVIMGNLDPKNLKGTEIKRKFKTVWLK